jgi:hypothetical protein
MVNKWSGVKLPSVSSNTTYYNSEMEDQYWKAVSEYGDDEAVHVLADMWGASTHHVKKIIKEIDSSWL